MSRGPGAVQRFILSYLAAGHPEPVVGSSLFGERRRRLGHSLRTIAAAYSGTEVATRSTETSFARALKGLQAAGLVEVRHRFTSGGDPYLRLRRTRAERP